MKQNTLHIFTVLLCFVLLGLVALIPRPENTRSVNPEAAPNDSSEENTAPSAGVTYIYLDNPDDIFNDVTLSNCETDTASTEQIIYNSAWKASFLGAREYDVIKDDNMESRPMTEGTHFLVLYFRFMNLGSTRNTLQYDSFHATLDGAPIKQIYTGAVPDLYPMIGANLMPGKDTYGSVVFEVPDDWQELLIEQKDFNSGDTLNFRLQSADLQ